MVLAVGHVVDKGGEHAGVMHEAEAGHVSERGDDDGAEGVEAGVRRGKGGIDVVRRVPVLPVIVAALRGHAMFQAKFQKA